MPNLYMLTNDVEDLYQKLMQSVDEETGEIDTEIANALAVKKEEFDKKAIAVGTVYRRFDITIDQIDAEIKRLTDIKEKAKKVRERLKNSLKTACEKLGVEKIDGISARISFTQSQKTIVDNETLIPDGYFNITISKKPDLTKIKKDINSGVQVPGAHVENCKNIQIK